MLATGLPGNGPIVGGEGLNGACRAGLPLPTEFIVGTAAPCLCFSACNCASWAAMIAPLGGPAVLPKLEKGEDVEAEGDDSCAGAPAGPLLTLFVIIATLRRSICA